MITKFGSIMKDPSRSTENLAVHLPKNRKVLIVDGLDGWNALCFAFKEHHVTIYEPIHYFVHGGVVIDHEIKYKIHGLNKRVNGYKLNKRVSCIEENYYENTPIRRYDLVYANRTLSRDCNAHISIKDKIKTLISSVNEQGELYLVYLLAIDEDDYETYPANQYPRTGEVPMYFDNENWEVIMIRERSKVRLEKGHFGNPKDHYHKYGYIHVRRKKSKQIDASKHIFRYSISIG